MAIFRRDPKLTFPRRFLRMAIFWGIPMVCLEFIGIPRYAWGTALVLAVPATLIGVLAGTALEHWFVTYKQGNGRLN